MKLENPVVVYTAISNLEAQLVVEMLQGCGIDAYAMEDVAGYGLWMFGTITQIHRPKVFVDAKDRTGATERILQFEQERKLRYVKKRSGPDIQVDCEACGRVAFFPASQDGTTQQCPHCRSYVDVGSLPWEVDFGEPEVAADPDDAD